VLITWYAKQGVNNPFAVFRSIRVYGGGGGGYAVAAVAAEFRKDTAAVGEVAVSGGALGDPTSADSSGAAVWKEVCPFADSGDGVRAVLLSYGGMTALICDTALFAPLRSGGKARFHEKLDILAVPPSSTEELLAARNRFRPRFVVAAPPCANDAPARNILCAKPDENGRWRYDFTVKGGKLELSGDHPR